MRLVLALGIFLLFAEFYEFNFNYKDWTERKEEHELTVHRSPGLQRRPEE